MASPAEFARRMRERGRQVEEGADELVVLVAGAINQTVVLATPVDTGRARANWQAAVGTPITDTIDDTDKGGGQTVARNDVVIRQRSQGQAVYLSNNLEYIGFLNQGSSAQAPANFVEQAVEVGARAARSARLLR